jgi:homoserine kinase type II
MAVYTHLSAEKLAELIATYDVGSLVSAKGIAEGVSNSNWLIETSGAQPSAALQSERERAGRSARQFILTMYERRIEIADLPYFLGLLDHLASRDCPVPATIHTAQGDAFQLVDGKAIALIEFLPGVSPSKPTPAQVRAVGQSLAQMHLAAQDFGLSRENSMGFAQNLSVLEACGEAGLAQINSRLPAMLDPARAAAKLDLSDLPQSQIHADLFPDNVLMMGDQVSGMIDFYFACTGSMAMDLATTHAAWCFDEQGAFLEDQGRALIEGYESCRPLTPSERAALPQIAEAVCIRFIASRAEDWLDTPSSAQVSRKDPMQFVARFDAYQAGGQSLFI